MARKRIGMKKIRDVIRLKSTTELSERQIARALSISRPIVAKYWNGFLFSGLAYEQIAEMADSELLRLVERPRESKSARYREMAQYFSHIVVELKRKGVTLQLLWEEYKEKHSDGYQYSQFCYHFNNWKNASEVRMHIKHKAGDKMFVDYAGEKWPITDTRTGKKRLVEVFVAVLGASGLSYVEATASQQEQDWIRSNERALWYFGGVAAAIIPDNLRSAVSQSDRYEPGINPTFDDFAEYYDTVIIPARVRKARDKALVLCSGYHNPQDSVRYFWGYVNRGVAA
jgi:transposase